MSDFAWAELNEVSGNHNNTIIKKTYGTCSYSSNNLRYAKVNRYIRSTNRLMVNNSAKQFSQNVHWLHVYFLNNTFFVLFPFAVSSSFNHFIYITIIVSPCFSFTFDILICILLLHFWVSFLNSYSFSLVSYHYQPCLVYHEICLIITAVWIDIK